MSSNSRAAASSIGAPWPAHFPKKCPKTRAVACDGRWLYRYVVRYNYATTPVSDFNSPQYLPVGPDNMISYAEIGRCPTSDPCDRAGLSCFDSRRAADELRKLPLFRDAMIVRAELGQTDGKMHHNPRTGHINLWLYRDVLHGVHRRFELDE